MENFSTLSNRKGKKLKLLKKLLFHNTLMYIKYQIKLIKMLKNVLSFSVTSKEILLKTQ